LPTCEVGEALALLSASSCVRVGIGKILPTWSKFGLRNEKKERERTREIYAKKIYGFKFFARLFTLFNLSDFMYWSNSTNWEFDYNFKILEKNHEISYHWKSNILIQTGLQWRRFAY